MARRTAGGLSHRSTLCAASPKATGAGLSGTGESAISARRTGSILLIGREHDLCCQSVLAHLTQSGRDVLFLPEDRLFPELRFTWEISGSLSHGAVGRADRRASFGSIRGVLARFSGIPVTPDEFRSRDGRYISAEWNALALAWLNRLECPIINRLRPELWYKHCLRVPEIQSLAPSCRFRWPRTLVTTRQEAAVEFYRQCGGRMRYSPLTQNAGYLIEGDESLQRLASLRGVLPLYLTEVVNGKPIDAYVIENSVIPVSAEGDLEPAVPGEVKERCVAIARELDLAFCLISLCGPADGEWYCLGVDRMPSMYGVSAETLSQITNQLVAALECGRKRALS